MWGLYKKSGFSLVELALLLVVLSCAVWGNEVAYADVKSASTTGEKTLNDEKLNNGELQLAFLQLDDVVDNIGAESAATCGLCIVESEGVCEADANTAPCIACGDGGGTWNTGGSSCDCVAPETWDDDNSICSAAIHMSNPATFTWSSPDHFGINNDNINLTAYNPPAYTDLSGVATTTMTVAEAGNYRFTGEIRGRSGGYGLARIYVNGILKVSTNSASYASYDFTVPLNSGFNSIQLTVSPYNGLNCCGNTMEVRAAYITPVP